MKLDRNTTKPRRGKYALIKLRETSNWLPGNPVPADEIKRAMNVLEEAGVLDFGRHDDDFFVIRLKDKYAGPSLRTYAEEARRDDSEYADEIIQLAINAETHPMKKKPD